MTTTLAPWTGRILHIDLTSASSAVLSSLPYVPAYLGGRGLAARLAWEMLPPGITAFDARNALFFMPGALVGTPAPSSGRVTICGLSPQAHPHEWYTRASLGGHWGAALKYAGWDGLIVTGRATRPLLLYIDDGQVTFCEASDLWGRGLVETQRTLRQRLGADWRVLAIGPAGEQRCRYAIIATGTESAAGQGGFGAVMGDKRLKAIAVRGRGGVPIAQPQEMLRRSRQVFQRLQKRYGAAPITYGHAPEYARQVRPSPCTFQCPGACGGFYRAVPGVAHPERRYSGQFFCCAPRFRGGDWIGADLGFAAGFEIAQVCNDLGLNHWELAFGLVPWLLRCREAGEWPAALGEASAFDFTSPAFWLTFITKIARREEWGDILAEGAPRAAERLGVGQEIVRELYPAWGQASHWDGHGTWNSPYFPFWLVTALQWALDTRDPLGGGHGFTTNIVGLIRRLQPAPDDEETWRKLAAVGERLYGSALAVDPRSGYEDKALPAVLHQDRNALKDAVGLCDNIFPLLTDPEEEDYLVAVDGVEGRFLEHYLFEPASDVEMTCDTFYRVGTRVFTAERLLAIRNWGRSRATDETIIPYLRHPEGGMNPYIGHKVALDVVQFRALLDACYALRGWDPITAAPTPETLRALGLEELAI